MSTRCRLRSGLTVAIALLALAACDNPPPVPPAPVPPGPSTPDLVLEVVSPADTTVGADFEATLTAEGGLGPYTFSAEALPGGLLLDSGTGVISGSATEAGDFAPTLTVLDAAGNRESGDLALKVYDAPVFVTQTLPAGIVGAPYEVTLELAGGKPPLALEVASNDLPPGLSLDPVARTLSGTPITAGAFSFTLTATEANGEVASALLALTVYEPLVVTTTSLAETYVGDAFIQTLAASGGQPPLSWSVVGGTLPPGLTLSAVGVLAGTVGAAQNGLTHTFTVEVSDAAGHAASQELSVTTWNPPVLITAPLTTALEGVSYMAAPGVSETVRATGGKAPLTLQVSGLPPGLVALADGTLAGIPGQGTAGSHPLGVTVTDANGRGSTAQVPLEVGVPMPLPRGGTRSVAPQGSPLTDVLTVFVVDLGTSLPIAGSYVRVRKNGLELSPPLQGITDATGKVVFTGLGLNGTTDTVDVTASGHRIANVTYAGINAAVVTLMGYPYPLPADRAAMPAVLLNGKLHAPMGYGAGADPNQFVLPHSCINAMQRLEAVSTAEWSELVPPAMPGSPSPRADYGVAVVQGDLFLYGGRHCVTREPLPGLYRFDPDTGTWTGLATSGGPGPRYGMAMAPLGPSRFLVYGGYGPGDAPASDVWLYDVPSQAWLPGPAGPAFSGGGETLAAAADPGRVEALVCAPDGACVVFDASGNHTPLTAGLPAEPGTRLAFSLAADAYFAVVDSGTTLQVFRRDGGASPNAPWPPFVTQGAPPSGRRYATVVHDPASGALIVNGGRGVRLLDDLWTLDLSTGTWTRRSEPPSIPPPTPEKVWTLSGTIDAGLPAQMGDPEYVQVTVHLGHAGIRKQSAVVDPATGQASYSVTGIPDGQVAWVTAELFDHFSSFAPTQLLNFADLGTVGPITGHRTLDFAFPPASPWNQSTLDVLLPASWLGGTTFSVTTRCELPGFGTAWNGDGSYTLSGATATLTASYLQRGRQQSLAFRARAPGAGACGSVYWKLRNIPAGPLLAHDVTDVITGQSPGRAECDAGALPLASGGTYAFDAPGPGDMTFLLRGPNRQVVDWVFVGPYQSGLNTITLPLPSTAGPSRASAPGQEVAWMVHVYDLPGTTTLHHLDISDGDYDRFRVSGARIYLQQ